MKILKLSPYYAPERVSSSHLTADLERALVNAGYEIEVICPTPTRGIDAKERAAYKKVRYEEKAGGKIVVRRFAMPGEKRNTILRALRYFAVNAVQKRKGKKVTDADLVWSGSTPPTQGLTCAKVAAKLTKKKGKKVPMLYIIQDIFPDSLVNAGMAKKGGLLWKIGRKMEDKIYRSAERIIVISEDFKKNIMDKGVPEEKIDVIPNWVNTDNVYDVDRADNDLFDKYALDRGKFWVCYSGRVGHSQNLRLLLDVAETLEKELPDVRFAVIGEGPAREETEAAIAEKGIGNVRMLPFQPYEDIAKVFSLGDAGLIISKAGVGGSSVPSKTWGILAASRPIIASFDRDSDLCRLIDKVGCGVTADADSKEELIGTIRRLYENREEGRAMGARGARYLKENLDKDLMVGRYLSTVRRVLDAQADGR